MKKALVSFLWGALAYYILRIVFALLYVLTLPVNSLDCSLASTRGPFDYGIQPCTSAGEYLTVTIQNFASDQGLVFALFGALLLGLLIFCIRHFGSKGH